jgi:hypothetical protein
VYALKGKWVLDNAPDELVNGLRKFVPEPPKRNCESGAVLGRELEKVRKWAGCHVWILSRVRHECNAARVPPPLWPRSDDPDHP